MNSNRLVLRQTQNHISLKSSSSIELINKSQLSIQKHFNEQENLLPTTTSRPILTAARTKKQTIHENEDERFTPMLISPAVEDDHLRQEKSFDANANDVEKTHEELEQELYELPDYRQSILEHLKSIEHLCTPNANFMEFQSDINCDMRSILIDWLIEVTDEYKLIDETLFLCVQYVDRFLSTVSVTRSKLQLLGTTCMYIASKYEEMYPPALDEFSFITDNTYDVKHILRMEQIVIKTLNFCLSGPTCYTFLQHYLVNLKQTFSKTNIDDHKSLTMLSNYFCTLTLLHDRSFSSYSPSKIAASCLLYSLQLLNRSSTIDSLWSKLYIQLTTYSHSDLNQCRLALEEIHTKTYYKDKTLSSLLRRYLNGKQDLLDYEKRVRELIHYSKIQDDNDDEILDLTLDEFDDDNMSLDHNR